MKNLFALFCIALLLFTCSQEPRPQEPDPVRRKSPIAIASITHKPTNSYVKIVYGQPYKKGRKIFGELAPYGKVWRTGANEATEMTTTKPLQFNGNKLSAGTYALFTIPRTDEWTIILNDSLGQWGAFEYTEAYDRLRTQVPRQRSEQVMEKLTIQFEEIMGDSSAIIIEWDTMRVEVPIMFTAPNTIR